MRAERLRGSTNVVRFPVELRARPTLDLLREIAPDVRVVLSLAASFELDRPVDDLRDRVDAETAEYILNVVSGSAGEQAEALAELVEPALRGAVAACRAAHMASIDAGAARRALASASTEGAFWIEPLQARSSMLSLRAAERMIEAHARVEEAEGVVRGVSFARRSEAWVPRDVRAEAEALFGSREGRQTG